MPPSAMTLQDEILSLIENMQLAHDAKKFEPFIQYIKFPNFKNIEKSERINFDFPFTVFTGINGSGKSSALHALYGAPFGKSTSDFWFSTNVDPITDVGTDPSCFIYGFHNPFIFSFIELVNCDTAA